MATFLHNQSKKLLMLFLHLWIFVPPCIASAGDLTIGKIWAAGYFGKDNMEEIAPYSEIEKWEWGEFDPPKIILRLDVASQTTTNAKVVLFLRVKAGEVLFSERAGIDLPHLRKTARWQEERLLSTKEISVNPSNMERFSYIFPLDELVGELHGRKTNLSPYLLSFRVVVQDMRTLEKHVVKKQIYLIPDNISDY